METADKQIVEKQTYVHDENHKDYATKGTALGVGIPALVLGGLSALAIWGKLGNGLGNSVPENVNINAYGGTGLASASPTPFQAWENACEGKIALTNEMWGLKMNTMQQMYDHRQTDIAEKFSLYKSQTDADFGLYKSTRDSFDALTEKLNASTFGLYKEQRDNYDKMCARVNALETQVAVNAAIRPYQDKLIQCEIEKAYTAGVNYTDRKTCRMIQGNLVLPSTPTVTGFQSVTCPCNVQNTSTTPAA